MAILASVFVALAAVLHVYIFLMEAAWWTRPKIWQRFGLASQTEAETTRVLAYNQGFYNLFLAIGAVVGIGMVGSNRDASVALIVMSTGSMLSAALVLVTSDRSKLRAAVIQGLLPALALVSLLVWAL